MHGSTLGKQIGCGEVKAQHQALNHHRLLGVDLMWIAACHVPIFISQINKVVEVIICFQSILKSTMQDYSNDPCTLTVTCCIVPQTLTGHHSHWSSSLLYIPFLCNYVPLCNYMFICGCHGASFHNPIQYNVRICFSLPMYICSAWLWLTCLVLYGSPWRSVAKK